jgi:hypothetical protein
MTSPQAKRKHNTDQQIKSSHCSLATQNNRQFPRMRPTALSYSIFALLTVGTLGLPQLNAGFTKGIIGVFDDASCGVNQKDFSDTDRTCHELPGQSMKIWWLKKGCGGTYRASVTSMYDC